MSGLPTGTVTFLFTDIEGSTALLQRLGDRRYADILEQHRRLLRAAFEAGGGQEVDTQGDAFLVAFPRAKDALATAVAAQQTLMKYPWPEAASLRIRMGLHTGEPVSGTGGYVGLDVHRAARICVAGHGGQILLSDALHGLAARDLPPNVSLRDLGTHRLKDLREQEHLFQVIHPELPADFPPLKALDVRPNNLPIQLTSFIGRELEIGDVKESLSTARLVTLTGAGGSGKTRLALQVATAVLDYYPDGVWLAQLAPLSDPMLVPKVVASALSIPEQPGRPMTETVVDYLRPKAPLLLLDNCEHLLQACAQLATTLLQACPNLRIVATSQEALGIAGELTYSVPSLSLPDLQRLPPPETLTQYEAIRLFVERAAFSKPGFQITSGNAAAVAQVVWRLDGIPLAIELAAARVKVLTLEQIASRLDDRFRLLTGGRQKGLPRHRTLRAAMDWSYGLLSEKERAVLRRLSTFAGGWTLEAAEAVCSCNDIEAADILDLLTQLVDKSLVVVETQGEEARYRHPETVRQYSLDRLMESEDAANVRRRHRDWFLGLAERSEQELQGPRQVVWLERLEVEHDNLRAALDWSRMEEGGAEAGLWLAGALWWFWFLRGYWSEGRQWLEVALARSGDAPSSALPKVLRGAAHFAWRQGDYERATTLCEQGLAMCRDLGDREGSAWLLSFLGVVATQRGDYTRGTALLDEALSLCEALGDKWLTSRTLVWLAIVARYQNDYGRAAAFAEKSLGLARGVGDRYRTAYVLRRLGTLALHQEECERAAGFYKESLTLCREVGVRWILEECLEGLAGVASGQGHYEQAARLFGTAEALRIALGLHRQPLDQADYEQRVASTRAALEQAAFAAAWAEGRAMTLEQAIEYALADQPG